MSGLRSWETLGVVITLIGVFFVGTVGLVAVVGLVLGLLSTLVLFVVPKRWRRAIIQATPSFWPVPIRQKYLAGSLETAPCVSSGPERFGGLNRVAELQGRRLLGVHGFTQMDVHDIEEDESIWLLEFEGGWWAKLVKQIAPSFISPTFQLAWNVYAPTIAKPAMADYRIEHLPSALGVLVGAKFLKEDSCISTEMMVLENRLIFEVQAQDGTDDVLVLRLGYLKAVEDYLRTGELDGLGNHGLNAQVVTPSKIAEMDDWELKRRLQRPIHNLEASVLTKWLAPTHFPVCAVPWDDSEQVQRLRILRQTLTEFLKWFRSSYKLSDDTVADPSRLLKYWSAKQAPLPV